MLYRFKSKNTGDVIMLEANGRHILELIGKEAGAKGIIQSVQMPAAIAALEAAIKLEETADKVESEDDAVPGDGIGLRQRAAPFIDMLKRSHHDGDDIVWGV